MHSNILDRARAFSAFAHEGQFRRYTNMPYAYHPASVKLLLPQGSSDEMGAAAYLHDVVEDTPITNQTIHNLFGEEIANMVWWLTDVSQPTDGNRAARKAIDRDHIACAPPDVKTIKLADLIDNSRSIKICDPKFWEVYREEKLQLLEVLREGDSNLWQQAWDICQV